MKEPEIRKPIEAGDQRKRVYKARFFDKYINLKTNDGDNKCLRTLILALPTSFTLSMQSCAKQYFQ